MSKPIFVVRLSNNRTDKEVDKIKESILEHPICKDYHVLVLRDENNYGDAKFECYNSNCTEIEFEKLKEDVNGMITKNTKGKKTKVNQLIGYDGC